MRRAMRWLAGPVLVGMLGLTALRADAGMSDTHALVVRGRVLDLDGKPLAGAVVGTRGNYVVSSTTDERGRFTIEVPLGSAAGLGRSPFGITMRASWHNRTLVLANGQSILAFLLSMKPNATVVRVESNLRDATDAIASAYSQPGATTAWVETEFGGGAQKHGTGKIKFDFVADVDVVSGRVLAGAPAPFDARPPWRDSIPAVAPASPAKPPVIPSSGIVQKPIQVAPAPKPKREKKPKHAADLPVAAAMDSGRALSPPVRAAAPPAAAPTPASRQAPPPVSAPPGRVKAIEAFATQPSIPFDSCACRLWGTVEIDWERPLERNFPVQLTLTGPATQTTEVEMFMGTPREFRLGPLPCGDYRLVVRPLGKLRYSIVRGDSVVNLHCVGSTQTRVVLLPRAR